MCVLSSYPIRIIINIGIYIMAGILINVKVINVEYSTQSAKIELNIDGFDIKEIVEEIGLDEVISACAPDEVLSYITFDAIKSFFEEQGYVIFEGE